MRLGINASIISPKPSGLGCYSENIINQLVQQRNNDQIVVYTSFPDRLDLFSNSAVRLIPEAVQPISLKGHLNRFSWAQFTLPGIIHRDKIDLLLNTYVDGPLFLPVPQIITIHDLLPLIFPQEYPRQRLYFKTCVRTLANKAKIVLTCSEHTKKDIVRCFGISPLKIRTVHLGFDPTHFYPRKASAQVKGLTGGLPYILYLGNLLPHKNVSGVIRAFANISKKFPHLLLIAGNKDPRYFPGLQALTKSLEVNQRVVFLDYLTYAQIPELLSSCDVFVFASLYEGFGLPLLEAMSCGAPVVTSNSSSMPEVCADSAIYVNPYSYESISEGIKKVLSDNALRDSLIAKGVERSRLFSWKNTGKDTYAVLREALAK